MKTAREIKKEILKGANEAQCKLVEMVEKMVDISPVSCRAVIHDPAMVREIKSLFFKRLAEYGQSLLPELEIRWYREKGKMVLETFWPRWW